MKMFKGSYGVRAGWRFLAYVGIAVGLGLLIGRTFGPISGALHLSDAWLNALAPVPMLINEVLLAIPFLAATVVMARFERRSILSYGFSPSPRAAPRFVEGIMLGLVAPGIIGALMIAFGGMQIHGFGLAGSGWITYPLGWLFVMLMVGFTEEMTFRGYPLFALSRGTGFWPAASLMTLLFAAAHLGKPGENPVDIASIALLGFFNCFALWKTGSLWLVAGFHFAFDFMQFFVIGTRNGAQTPVGTLFNVSFPGAAWINGGALGTEASYFVFPVILALYLYVAWRFRRIEFDPGG